ncbi:MAG: amidohydrolase family protein, partial [Candidatus Wallbacteria bacterium]|nr:amidohydrolase family protein [Candidatus Wallbacteria bacterium]
PFCFKGQKDLGMGDFGKIPNGAPGVENRMSLIFNGGVAQGRISLNRFVQLTSTNAAKMFGLFPRKGTIAVGSDADLVIFDAERTETLSIDNPLTHHMRVDYNTYEGMRVKGYSEVVLSRGKVVCDKGQWKGKSGAAVTLYTGTGNMIENGRINRAWKVSDPAGRKTLFDVGLLRQILDADGDGDGALGFGDGHLPLRLRGAICSQHRQSRRALQAVKLQTLGGVRRFDVRRALDADRSVEAVQRRGHPHGALDAPAPAQSVPGRFPFAAEAERSAQQLAGKRQTVEAVHQAAVGPAIQQHHGSPVSRTGRLQHQPKAPLGVVPAAGHAGRCSPDRQGSQQKQQDERSRSHRLSCCVGNRAASTRGATGGDLFQSVHWMRRDGSDRKAAASKHSYRTLERSQ